MAASLRAPFWDSCFLGRDPAGLEGWRALRDFEMVQDRGSVAGGRVRALDGM